MATTIADETAASLPDVPDRFTAFETSADDVGSNNPRKRKKSSRACDHCHSNHQPCDNQKPRCSYCEKHNKPCTYQRPQKKRGPAQGYRNALQSMRESAAAWGVAMTLIPDLSSIVEAAISQSEQGKRLARDIKDPEQQERFIQKWQQSGAFRTFFGDDESVSEDGTEPVTAGPSSRAPPSVVSTRRPSSNTERIRGFSGSQASIPTMPSSLDGHGSIQNVPHDLARALPQAPLPSFSHSDLLARDATRSSDGFSQTLGSLGFAPGETVDDFFNMSSNPEPIEAGIFDEDPLAGTTEMEQRVYYELITGKRFFTER